VDVVAGTRIVCSFYIADAEPGVWDVLVVNPDGTDGKRSNAFIITAPPTPTVTEAPQISGIDMAANPPRALVDGTITIYAIVLDQFGHPMAGQSVEFGVIEGPGSVDPETTQTDGNGQAQTELTSSEAGVVRVKVQTGTIANSVQVEFTELLEERWIDSS